MSLYEDSFDWVKNIIQYINFVDVSMYMYKVDSTQPFVMYNVHCESIVCLSTKTWATRS